MGEVEAVTRCVSRVLRDYREFWSAWFGYHSGREVLESAPTASGWTRAWVSDPGLFLEHVALCEERGWPCYMSVNTYSKRDVLDVVHALFWDFDSKENPPDLDAAWRDASRLHDELDRYYGIEALIVESGLKGFHVYAWLQTTVEVLLSQRALASRVVRRLQAMLMRGLELPTMDVGVLGDVARLARVPYTVHEPKVLKDGSALPGGLCQPLTPEGRSLLLDASTLDGIRGRGVPVRLFAQAAEWVRTEEEERRLHLEEVGASASPELRHVRPCFPAMLGRLSLPHKMREAAVSEYHHRAGLGEDELVALFRGQEDFDEDRTRYQVRHILKRGYKPWRCSTLQAEGVCLGEECPLRKGKRRMI
jgi:hypothetical protein